EPSYNRNYNDIHYPHDLPSFPCCDNCGESHETFQCQPIDQNIDFSSSDQIQNPQYPDVHPPSQEISNEVFHAKEDLMKSIQTFLEEFNCIPFEEKATILLQAWFRFFAIKHDQPENSNELFQNLLEDLKELAEYKESLENSSNEIAVSNSNEEKKKPPQDFDIHQLIEECSTEVSKEQKQSMEDTMLELVEICRQKSFFEVKNVVEQPAERGNRIKKSLQNFRVIHKRSISLKNTSQISPIHAVAPILSIKEPEYSRSMGDDDISSDDDDFEDIEYVEASLPDPEIVSLAEENVVHQEEEEFDLEDISQIQDVDLREKLLSITRLIANIESLNDNPTPDCVFNSSISIPIFEESDNSLLDNSLPEFQTFCDHTEETRSGNTTTHADDSLHDNPLLEEADLFLASDNLIPPDIENFADNSKGDIRFLEELLIDDSILFHESSDSNFEDNPGKFDDSFMFVKVFSLLSAESEDTIFDPGFTSHRLKFLVFGYLSRSKRSSYTFFENSLGKSISLISIA
nr:hypothetical protein [Tanacetum cinerariifolium]